jgi:GT2 family glycosyltransferase
MGTLVDLSVVIVNWNTAQLTLRCLEALQRALPSELDAEVLVVDNASTDGSAERIAAAFPEVRLIRRAENGGFARANNEAFARARGAYCFLLNSDTEALPGSTAALLAYLKSHPRCGLVAPRLINGDGSLQYSCWRFPRWDTAALESLYLYRCFSAGRAGERLLGGYWDHGRARPVDWVMGAAMLVRREVLEATGGFDEGYFMFGEDMEWCWRIRRKGWSIDYEPAAGVVHLGGQSSRQQFADGGSAVKHEAYYHFCQQHLGPVHRGVLRSVNVAGALLRLGLFSVRRLCRPSRRHADAIRAYQTALWAHTGLARH